MEKDNVTVEADLKPELEVLKPELKPAENAEEAKEIAIGILAEVSPILKHAKELEVTDQATYGAAMGAVVKCSRARARVEQLFGKARDLANQAHKAITGSIKSLVDPLKQAESIYGSKAYEWDKAEKARMAAAEIARVKKEEADKEEENLGVATFLDAAGAHEEAEQILDEPVRIAPRKVTGPDKPSGTSTRENFQWKCTELKKLVAAVAGGKVPLSVLTTADTVITKMVKALKYETNLPGIKVWDAGTVAVRKR